MILKGDMIPVESIAFKKYKKAAHRREIRNGIFWMAFAIAMFIVCMPE